MNGWLIAIGLMAAHVVLVYALIRSGKMEKWNLSTMLGIVLMLRTQRGRKLIDSLARPKRFWAIAGDLGTVVCLLGMAGLMVLFVWSVWVSLRPDSETLTLGAREILVIPGVNPFVPLWYGIAGLIVTLVVHEGGHGVLARANGLRLKSLGLLYAVVPIGAFVEPDDLDMKVAPRRHRLRVFSAGPGTNMAFTLVFLLAFGGLMGSLAVKPGAHILATAPDGPAQLAGIRSGDSVISVNGTPTPDDTTYATAFLAQTVDRPVVLGLGDGRQVTVTPTSYWTLFDASQQDRIQNGDHEYDASCQTIAHVDAGHACAEAMTHRPRLGVSFYNATRDGYLLHPLTSGLYGFAGLAAQPVAEIRGTPLLSIALPAFTETPFNHDLFWVLANLAFWCFWLNLMVGITNMLPMIPLDGGHIFRDAIGSVVQVVRPNATAEAREKAVRFAVGGVSIFVLLGMIVMIAGPHLLR